MTPVGLGVTEDTVINWELRGMLPKARERLRKIFYNTDLFLYALSFQGIFRSDADTMVIFPREEKSHKEPADQQDP